MTDQEPKAPHAGDPDELPLEILDVVHGGRRAPYSKGELDDIVRRIHAPQPANPGLVIPPSSPKRER